jgi:uncharacterized repeat protein (TIGR01451 family)
MFCVSTKDRSFRAELRRFGLASAVGAVFLFAASDASAQATADTVILGVATMDYADGSGTNAYRATASSTITIQLVESQLTVSGPPTAAAPGDTAPLPADQAGASGNTLNYLYALTANANGDDIYDLDVSITTATDVSGESVSWSLLAADGATPVGGPDPATVALGSAIVTAVPAANTLQFPGGTLTEFTAGDLVVFGGIDYLVASVAPGTAASHSNAGGVPHADEGTTVAEVPAQLVLAANPSGANVAPAFTGAGVGAIAREQIFVSISVTATATKKNKDGIVDFDLTTNPDGDPSLTAGAAGVESRFGSVAVSVQKDARNLTTGGTFAATASGAPGDVVEYRVTVSNAGSNAKNVIVTDQVPPYTTLVGDAFGVALFAQAIRDGGTPVLLTTIADDDEDSSVASGNAAGTAAGSGLNFYVGPSNKDSNDKGGDLANGTVVELFYQVTID